MTTSTDRIEKKVFLRAPRSKVWKALTTGKDFGAWFGVALTDDFAPGARLAGAITHPGYSHLTWEVVVETMEPERLLSWRWHPYAVDPAKDYSAEPSTLVVFTLDEVDGGTMLTVVESGFDQIPVARRTEAYRSNDEGWHEQTKNIAKYLDASG